jgi:hypothetical protein
MNQQNLIFRNESTSYAPEGLKKDNLDDATLIEYTKQHPNLLSVNLNDCTKLTDKSIVKLFEYCPKIERIFYVKILSVLNLYL